MQVGEINNTVCNCKPLDDLLTAANGLTASTAI